jgi:hypothetical protein
LSFRRVVNSSKRTLARAVGGRLLLTGRTTLITYATTISKLCLADRTSLCTCCRR